MPRKKTHEEFVKEVYDLVGDEYTVLGEYKTSMQKIEIIHNECQYVWNVTSNSFLSGQRCPKCYQKSRGDKNRKTHTEFLDEVYQLVGNEYTVVDTYKGAMEKIVLRHESCGNHWETIPNSFLRGTRCPSCTFRSNQKTHDDFVKEVISIRGDIYEFLTEYTTTRKSITIKHRECGHVWSVLPNHLIRKSQKGRLYCTNCNWGNKERTLGLKAFKDKVAELADDEFLVLGEYVNTRTPIEMKHNISSCNHEYTVRPHDFIHNDNRCPKCAISKGEKRISLMLNLNNISFVEQYIFKDCKDTQILRFDFAIFDDTGNLMFLIEYDGEQHFRSVDYFGGEDGYKSQQKRDKIKNEYCAINKIKLYRIPYFLFSKIEQIINKIIHNEDIEVDETSFLVKL